jgi:hypothetical protein
VISYRETSLIISGLGLVNMKSSSTSNRVGGSTSLFQVRVRSMTTAKTLRLNTDRSIVLVSFLLLYVQNRFPDGLCKQSSLDLFLKDSRTFLDLELKLDNAQITNILVSFKPEIRPRVIDLLGRLVQTITSFERDILDTNPQGINSHLLAIKQLEDQTKSLGGCDKSQPPSDPISTVTDAQWHRTRNHSESLLKACHEVNTGCKTHLVEWREITRIGDQGESLLLSTNARKRLARLADYRILVVDVKLVNKTAARLRLGWKALTRY